MRVSFGDGVLRNVYLDGVQVFLVREADDDQGRVTVISTDSTGRIEVGDDGEVVLRDLFGHVRIVEAGNA